VFRQPEAPKEPGIYEYQPFRGPGHLNLSVALKAKPGQLCSIKGQGQVIQFEVASLPGQGKIEITNIALIGNDRG
jgi:hypothetical protein